MEVILKVEQLNAFYSDVRVLHEISMEVRSSEIVGIVGSNAAGKSTLLSSIAGLIGRKEGSILFRNQRIDKVPPHKIAALGIVLVPEGRRLFPYLSVRDNLLMGAYIKDARPHIPERMEQVFSLLPVL
jgi:branched-chain amino acid transport system ATP-binding protein